MQLSMDLGQVALIFIQIIALIITFFVHSRQLSAVDIEKRDRGLFGASVSKALQAATDALAGVEKIDKEQYQSLAKKYAALLQEVEELKVKLLAQDESIKSLSNKLASRDRADAAMLRRVQKPIDDDEREDLAATQIKAGQDPLEVLKAQGLAYPLNPQTQPQPQPTRIPGFGVVAKGA